MKKEKPLKLAGLITEDERMDLLFTVKCTTAMMRSRKLGVIGRKLQK